VKLFDTHAHLDQVDFDADRDAVVERARAAGVSTILAIGTTAAASARCVELAAQYDGVYAAVGIQPNYVAAAGAGDWAQIVALARAPRVVAIGETGLDRYWDHTPFEMQQDYFDRHLRLAAELGLPFVVHMRDCSEDILVMLRAAHARSAPLVGVMHSFTGDAAMAAECAALGMHVSFAGMATYKKSAELRAVAATIPADRILIETDSPYLSPEPVRGTRRNEPANLVHTATCLAAACGHSPEAFAEQTTRNAQRLFKIGER
jgi:TatD DNase family protein